MRTSIFIDDDSISARISIGESVCMIFFKRFLVSSIQQWSRQYHEGRMKRLTIILSWSGLNFMLWMSERGGWKKSTLLRLQVHVPAKSLQPSTDHIPPFFSFNPTSRHAHKSNLSTQLSTNQRRGTDIRYVRNEALWYTLVINYIIYNHLLSRGMINNPAWSVFTIRPPRERGDDFNYKL